MSPTRRRSTPTDAPDVTVMVTTYQGAERIGRCLESLARQTLAPDRFEILVVQNGPACDTPRVITEFSRAHPDLRVRLLELRRPGLGHARNVGLRAARGAFVTYVDDDDWITDGFLESMLRHASAAVVPVALVSARAEGQDPREGHTFDNYAARRILRHAGRTVHADQLPAALNYNAGKLLPTDLARRVQYDESLRSGEDFVYWLRLLALRPFRLHVVAPEDDAVYCRLLREGSLGRQDASYDFLVTQRLECLQQIESVRTPEPVSRRVAAALARAQASWINRYLREHPQDRGRVVADARAHNLRRVPWTRVNRGLARCLVIHREDPSSVFEALRTIRGTRAEEQVVDVISDSSGLSPGSGVSGMGVDTIARTWHDRFDGSGRALDDDLDRVLSLVGTWEQDQGEYDTVVTTATGLRATVTAASLRLSRPDLAWEAHVRRPGRQQDRTDPDWVRSRLGTFPGGDLHGGNLRLLTVALADRLVVRSEDELAELIAECPEGELRARCRRLATVAPRRDDHTSPIGLGYDSRGHDDPGTRDGHVVPEGEAQG